MQKKPAVQKIIILGLALSLVGIIFSGYFWWRFSHQVEKEVVKDQQQIEFRIFEDNIIGQTFIAKKANLSAIGLPLSFPQTIKDNSFIALRVKPFPTAEEVLREVKINGVEVNQKGITYFNFRPLQNKSGEKFFWEIQAFDYTEDNPLILQASSKDFYAPGSLYLHDQTRKNKEDLVFEYQDLDTHFVLQYGNPSPLPLMLSGTIFFLCLIFFLHFLLKIFHFPYFTLWQNLIFPILVCATLAFFALFPFWQNLDHWGIFDWDLNTVYQGAARESILSHKQFPLWNPYACGGTVLLAYPESSFLSPFFLPVLIWGEIIGMKINVFLHLFLGILGMFYLARFLKIHPLLSFLPGIIFFFSGFFPMQLSEGHLQMLGFAWTPWVLFFYFQALKKLIYAIPSALFLTLILLEGGTYPFGYLLLFLIIFTIVFFIKAKNKKEALKKTAYAFCLTLGLAFLLSAIKIFPMIDFLREFPAKFGNELIQLPLSSLKNILLDSDQARSAIKFPGQTEGWYEYSQYLGIIPLLLIIFSLPFAFKKYWPLIAASLFFLLIPFWLPTQKALKLIPIIGDLRNFQRLIIMFILGLSLIAPFFLSWVARHKKRYIRFLSIFTALVVHTFIVFDLWKFAIPIYNEVFAIPPQIEKKSTLPFRQSTDHYVVSSDDNTFFLTYQNFLQNKGTVNRCFTVSIYPTSIPSFSLYNDLHPYPEAGPYKGEVYLENPRLGQADIIYFSPNKIRIAYNLKERTPLLLNQNYHKGWKTKDVQISEYKGKLAFVPKNLKGETLLYYRPLSFIIGFIVSILTLLAIIILFIFPWKKKKQAT